MKAYTPTPNYGPASYDLDLNVKIETKDCFSAVMNLLIVIPAAFFLKVISKPIILTQRFAIDHQNNAATGIIPGRLQEHI